MVQVGRIHKRIDRCVPGETGYCRKSDRGVRQGIARKRTGGVRQDIARNRTGGVRQGFRQEKVLILAETIPGENPKPVMYSQTPLFKSK